MPNQRAGGQAFVRQHAGEGHMQSYIAAGDGGGAGAAVGLDDIAIDLDRAFAQGFHIGDGAQGPANQPLDFLGASRLFAPGGFTVHALVGGPGQHAVFGGDPSLARIAQPRRHPAFDTGGTQHVGVAEPRHARSLGILGKAQL